MVVVEISLPSFVWFNNFVSAVATQRLGCRHMELAQSLNAIALKFTSYVLKIISRQAYWSLASRYTISKTTVITVGLLLTCYKSTQL